MDYYKKRRIFDDLTQTAAVISAKADYLIAHSKALEMLARHADEKTDSRELYKLLNRIADHHDEMRIALKMAYNAQATLLEEERKELGARDTTTETT